ncbi:hypothetical protein KFK09_002950 [Dendrobium nobile]|uniref:Calponin-homology (CH) domain-containing protein n=1 Tax=Dendrobium nobile TaxID=94219 RepID=A0A8T3C7R4_DENNO|nr:hypothetical protein KFK09_002950 [Dendrobium nobile]
MDRRRQPERGADASPGPPFSTPSHLFRDVSNLKTPKPTSRNPNPNHNLASPSPLFFTASKKTPYLSHCTSTSFTPHSTFQHRASSNTATVSRSKTAQRLKALELEQSQSSRKAQVRCRKILESFARSLAAWLNFLLQNPKDCGCKVGAWAADGQPLGSFSKGKGKRESLDGGIVEIGRKWRSPKRQRVQTHAGIDVNVSMVEPMTLLKKSLCKVCSLDDMLERMTSHMSSKSCNEVLLMMTQVCKNIDEGRLKMKPHCPLVTDLAVRDKAIKVLMSYNPLWLQIGFHILFGGDSLLLNNGDQDEHFLKEFTEKHFLAHAGIARTHALNKLVGGLYRPGYYEALGSVILKRFLLLAISLDKAKCESSLPIKHGIDSIDGGSPLLFTRQSHIKSSRQIIHEFLMDSMHGEGDLLAHLATLGCKVNYKQSSLCECEFTVKNIFEDLQDGIFLCRVVQLLQCNETILSKVVSPSDTPKKKLQNCTTVMQYLKDSGVPMSDSDGVRVSAADIANGDKELTCSILWNVFVHLQVPLLINRTSLFKEITKIKGSDAEHLKYNSINEMNLLLHWIQEVCVTQNIEVHSFSSLTDGRALTCLVKFYFGNDIYKLLFEKENEDEYNDERIRRFDCLPPTLLGIAFVQIVTAMLRNPPEVLHPCEIFDEDPYFDERSALILFVFLASQLINADKLDSDSFRFSQQACQSSMPRRSSISRLLHLHSDSSRSRNNLTELFFPHNKEDFGTYSPEAIIHKVKHIQIRWRGLIERRKYLQLKSAASILQAFVRCNLAKRRILGASNLRFSMVHRRSYGVINDGFINNFELRILIGSVIKLQRWWKRLLLHKSRIHAVISIQSFVRGWIARRAAAKRMQNIYMIQRLWRNIYLNRLKKSSVLAIQACIRGWITRETAAKKKCCILKIQRWWRNILYRKTSALIIQAYVRGWIARQKAARNKHDIVLIQSCWKGYLARKHSRPQLLNLRRRMKLSATNVNDEMRLINRLIVALSELLGHKSISNIRHTCATLDIATELSQKCCETLVDAGAIDILLKQIQLLNRGIPDQEVLKHVLSTLRNIARHKHLSQILINTPRSIEILFQELLRNKSEGFLISCQLLKRVCTTEEGLQAVRKLRGHVKRLNNVTVGLERKAKFLERNARLNHQRNLTLRRLREAISLMSLIVKD